jgi:hypothetical protein
MFVSNLAAICSNQQKGDHLKIASVVQQPAWLSSNCADASLPQAPTFSLSIAAALILMVLDLKNAL